MRIKASLLTLLLSLSTAMAHAYDLTAIQQLLASPSVQGQMAQTVAANPQLAAGMFASLSPSQTAVFNSQLKTITDKLFTPAEKAKLEQFQASPEGASIISKLPELTQQLAPVLMQIYLQPTGPAVK